MKQSTKRLTSSVLAVLLLVGAFTILFSLIQPAYGDISRLRGEITSRTAHANEQDRVNEAVKRLIESYESSQDVQLALSLAFPQEPLVSEFIGQVHGLLTLNGLVPQSFVVEPEKAQRSSAQTTRGSAATGEQSQKLTVDPPTIVSVRFTAIGTYSDFRKFVANVETNIRIMNMKKIGIRTEEQQPGQTQTNQDVLTFDGVIDAYYQGQKSDI